MGKEFNWKYLQKFLQIVHPLVTKERPSEIIMGQHVTLLGDQHSGEEEVLVRPQKSEPWCLGAKLERMVLL